MIDGSALGASQPGVAPTVVLAADWSKDPECRAVWKADLEGGSIGRLSWRGGDLARLLKTATELAEQGRVLVVIDAALGLTERAWSEVLAANEQNAAPRSFPDWLERQNADRIQHIVTSPEDWRPSSPFFRVPDGEGERTRFEVQIGHGRIYRRIDALANAKCPFLTGLPGFVGATSQSVWLELLGLLRERSWGLWPFDGTVRTILETRGVALAEGYPARMYRVALPETAVRKKSKSRARAAWLDQLRNSDWIRDQGAQLSNLSGAEVNDNEFDACAMAAALFRLIREKRSLDNESDDRTAEGGILALDAALALEGG